MSHKIPEPRIFKHQKLMNEFNEMMIRIKIHLFHNINTDEKNYKKPTTEELDNITNKIMNVLRKDNEPMVRYKMPKMPEQIPGWKPVPLNFDENDINNI